VPDASKSVEEAAPAAPVETDGSPEEERKLFLGGFHADTSEGAIEAAFGKHGAIVSVEIMKDKLSGKSRGFGYVTYASSEARRLPALPARSRSSNAGLHQTIECGAQCAGIGV
jgi:RNA recognition motif-containing protein